MAIHWRISFRAVRSNYQYHVNIYDDTYTGDPLLLQGGAQPFTIEENTDDDWFLPVRTQTGYIRIVDNGYDIDEDPFDWRDLIPATDFSRPVTFTDNIGNVLWRGYIQPRTFAGMLYADTQEREFPVACPLSVLSGVDIDTTAYGFVTFAELLQHLMAQTGWQWERIGFQGIDATEWLQKKIDWENFIEIDDENTRQPRYNCMEILTEVCKFWGWTCRTYREQIWFVAPDDDLSPSFTYFSNNDWIIFVNGGSASTSSLNYNYTDIDDDIYISTNNQVEIMRGIRRATVTADIGKKDDILTVDFEALTKLAEREPLRIHDNGDTRYFRKALPAADYETENYTISIYWDQTDIRGGFEMEDECLIDDLPTKHNFNWSSWLWYNDTVTNDYGIKFTTKYNVNLSHGMLTINAGTKSESQGFMTARLKIGDYYWNGSAWTTTSATFNMEFGVEDNETFPADTGIGAILDTRVLTSNYPAYTGFGIPINDTVGGILELELIDVFTSEQAGHRTLGLSDFEIGFVRELSYGEQSDVSRNEYTQDSGAPFSDERNVSLMFASDKNNAFGTSIIMNNDGSYCSTVGYTYSGGLTVEHPEEHLLNRITSRGATTKYKESVEIDLTQFDPNMTDMLTTTNMTGYPMAIGHDWINDKVRLLILEQ